VAPDTKRRRYCFDSLMKWAVEVIRHDISLLIVDLFPQTSRDWGSIHMALWDEFVREEFNPPEKPLILVSYSTGPDKSAYAEPLEVGDVLPNMPLFLEPELYVPVRLEATYRAEWIAFPAALKGLLETPE
jgi:hypothetical protein